VVATGSSRNGKEAVDGAASESETFARWLHYQRARYAPLNCNRHRWAYCFAARSLVFTARRYISVVYAVVVCLSVCCIKMAKRKITQIMPQNSSGTLVFYHQRSWRNSNGIIPYGGNKCMWGGLKLATFHEKRAVTRKRYKIDAYFQLKSNRKSYVLYQMAMFPITLGDPKPPKICIFRHHSYLRSE